MTIAVSGHNKIYCADARDFGRQLPANSINSIVTSPPYYGLRDYDVDGQIGLEKTPAEFVDRLVSVFDAYKHALRDDGVLWVDIGDSYANDEKWGGATGGKHSRALHGDTFIGRGRKTTGLPKKSLMLMPHRFAIAMQEAGWILRSDAPWLKRNVLPESVEDRATKAHEYVFMFVKSPHYWFDIDAVRVAQAGTAHSRGKGTARKEGEVGGLNRNNPSWNRSTAQYVDVPGGRNRRTSDYWFESLDDRIAALRDEIAELEFLQNNQGVLTGADTIDAFVINTASSSLPHFATFPPALIEPMILASCPPAVCARCGAPHVRIVEKEEIEAPGWSSYEGKNQTQDDQASHKRLSGNAKRLRAVGMDHDNPFPQRRTLGWDPTCNCNAGTQPGIVLDMFAGTGTTGVAAARLNRRYLLCDLSPKYVELAEQRLAEPIQIVLV